MVVVFFFCGLRVVRCVLLCVVRGVFSVLLVCGFVSVCAHCVLCVACRVCFVFVVRCELVACVVLCVVVWWLRVACCKVFVRGVIVCVRRRWMLYVMVRFVWCTCVSVGCTGLVVGVSCVVCVCYVLVVVLCWLLVGGCCVLCLDRLFVVILLLVVIRCCVLFDVCCVFACLLFVFVLCCSVFLFCVMCLLCWSLLVSDLLFELVVCFCSV